MQAEDVLTNTGVPCWPHLQMVTREEEQQGMDGGNLPFQGCRPKDASPKMSTTEQLQTGLQAMSEAGKRAMGSN